MNAPPEPQTAEPPREIRLALALNGGVSLAIWMGGCAVELDAVRRAHLGPDDLGGGRTRRVYHALCEALNRQVVIDVMAGTSAGGINAALISAAEVAGSRLHPDYVRERWVELGDLGSLTEPAANSDPRSLLSGDRFYAELLRTFEEIESQSDRRLATAIEPTTKPPKIDITATDLSGHQVNFVDAWGLPVSASESRVRFRFREAADFSARNLAIAARATAAFPIAFAPRHLPVSLSNLTGLDKPRWLIDGGLLDNAPIKTALDLIPRQAATIRTSRRLCYINPDPDSGARAAAVEKLLAGEQPPSVPTVLTRALAILRSAGFVAHLDALNALPTEASFGEQIGGLLAVDQPALEAVALGLLDLYRRERARLSIIELTGIRPTADQLQWLLDNDALPWIPPTAPAAAAGGAIPGISPWRWGIHGAQRAAYLIAELARQTTEADDPARADLNEERAAEQIREQIAARVVALDEQYTALDSTKRLTIDLLGALRDKDRKTEDLETASALVDQLRTVFEPRRRASEAMLGDVLSLVLEHPSPENLQTQLREITAIEVIRRASGQEADLPTTEPIRFIQLTPLSPTPILERKGASPSSAEAKLTGIRLGHFAAFRHRAWRANDYMWGRLDAATRIVDILLEEVGIIPVQAGAAIAEVVLPAHPSPAQVRLVAELAAENEYNGPTEPAALRVWLEAALSADLGTAQRPLARRACARAAQLEILPEEVARLVAEQASDRQAGATPCDLRELEAAHGDDVALINAMRRIDLPKRLGRDAAAQNVSDLTMRTGAKLGFVGLTMLRQAPKPIAGVLGLLRPLLFGLSGIVSHDRKVRLVGLLCFAAATTLLSVRAITTVARQPSSVQLAFSSSTLLVYVALLGLIGYALSPILRMLNKVSPAANALLLAAVGLAAGGLAILPDPPIWNLAPALTPLEFVLGPGADALPGPIAYATLAVTIAFAGWSFFPAAVRAPLNALSSRTWVPGFTLVSLLILALMIVAWGVPRLIDDGIGGGSRDRLTAIGTVVGIGIVSIGVVATMPRPRRSATVALAGVRFKRVEYLGWLDELRLGDSDGAILATADDGASLAFGSISGGIVGFKIAAAAERAASGTELRFDLGPAAFAIDPLALRHALDAAPNAPPRRSPSPT